MFPTRVTGSAAERADGKISVRTPGYPSRVIPLLARPYTNTYIVDKYTNIGSVGT